MMKKRRMGRLVILSLIIGLTGCGGTQNEQTEQKVSVAASENSAGAEKKKESEYVPGQGFRPSAEDYHMDRNGNYVDREGNTFDKEGRWQIPEGGSVDSQGRIYDKNGKLMGGGAIVGAVG